MLAETIVAPYDLPLSATTNVDGYAIDCQFSLEYLLCLPHRSLNRKLLHYSLSIASLQSGTYPVLTPRTFSLLNDKSLPPGQIYRINTGSPLPKGTDAVVMVEDTELVRTAPTTASDDGGEEDEVQVKLLVGAKAGENVRAPGSDVRKGETVLEKGTLITSLGGEVGTLAFVGQTKASTLLVILIPA